MGRHTKPHNPKEQPHEPNEGPDQLEDHTGRGKHARKPEDAK
ncbi:hypothetical protein [Nonomuraea cypriaca]|nr:hypothetical protein [Nonomuraea cypriaca]